jgi:hypothetical protein
MARGAIAEAILNSRAGVTYPPTETTGDSVNGHFFVWGPNKILLVRNTGGSPLNLTFSPYSASLDVFTPAQKVVAVPANSQRVFGPFVSAYRRTDDNDRVYVDVAGAALVLAVFNTAEF